VDVGIIVDQNGNTGNTFVPNVPVIETESTSYYNKTYQNTIKKYINGTIVEVAQQQPDVISIVYEESSDSTGPVILIVACVLIAVTFLVLLARFVMRKA